MDEYLMIYLYYILLRGMEIDEDKRYKLLRRSYDIEINARGIDLLCWGDAFMRDYGTKDHGLDYLK